VEDLSACQEGLCSVELILVGWLVGWSVSQLGKLGSTYGNH
jgi:hypothetical protein